MARKETWDQLRYFKFNSKTDRWGSPEDISDNLLLRLDDFRDWLGVPIYVTSGVKKDGHSKRSYHYKENGACAVDIVIPNYMESDFDLILDATRFGFTGIGFYPHWKWDGQTVGGLHLDMRPLKWDSDDTLNYSNSRWMGVMVDGKQEYIELDFQNVMDYSLTNTKISGMH